jgi:hypothetical protein
MEQKANKLHNREDERAKHERAEVIADDSPQGLCDWASWHILFIFREQEGRDRIGREIVPFYHVPNTSLR